MLTAEDRIAVDDLFARFVDAVARRCADDLRPLFTVDAIVEGPLEPPRHGVDAIIASMAAGFDTWEVLLLVPHALLVRFDEPRVATRWYLSEVGRRDGDDVMYTGVYHDELARDGTRWRFARRRFDLLYARTGAGSIVPALPPSLERLH